MTNPSAFADPWEFNRLFQKSMIAQDVLENMMFEYRNAPIEERIDINILDSLISVRIIEPCHRYCF